MTLPSDNSPSLPSYVRPDLLAVQPDLDLVANLLAGTRKMWEVSASAKYIRQWKDEDNAVYELRRKCETVFEGLGRTLSAAVGMLFAKQPAIEWNQSEAALAEFWQNVDAQGTKGDVFVKRFSEQAIRDGLAIILTDHPTPPPEYTPAWGEPRARELGLRPTFAVYAREQAISWRTGVVNNQRVLTQLVLHETAEVESEGFGVSQSHRYRVIRLINGVATWTLYEQTEERARDQGHFRVVGSGTFTNRKGQPANFLPVSIAYTGRTDGIMCATIPLLGVAWANLAHWQVSTDLRFARSVAAFAQPVVTGALMPDAQTGQPGTLKIGPLVAVQVQAEGSFEWKGPPVEAFDPLENGVKEKLEQLGRMGLSFLNAETRAAETAESKRIDSVAQNATLATAAQGIEDAVNMALEHAAWFMGIDKAEAPSLSINRDYEGTTMQSDMLSAYVSAIANAGLPPRLLLEAMQNGGLLAPEQDIEVIELEMMAAKEANVEQKRIEAEEFAQRGGFPAAA
jgi:hypothetical protein